MIVENKYYTEKINSMLEDKEIFEILQVYLNRIDEEDNLNENKKRILKFVSDKYFSKNFANNKINKFDEEQNLKENIILKDLKDQEESLQRKTSNKFIRIRINTISITKDNEILENKLQQHNINFINKDKDHKIIRNDNKDFNSFNKSNKEIYYSNYSKEKKINNSTYVI